MADVPSLEDIFCDRRFFGVETATPVQRAICRIAEGLPLGELVSCDDVRDAVGGDEALSILAPGSFRPRELDILAAIRSGKSRFVAAHAFWSSQIVDASEHLPGETLRYPILSVNVTSAESTFDQLAGTMVVQPLMKRLLVGDPKDGVLCIRRPDARIVEVRVAAGARAGANIVSVWLCGAVFEEYPRQASEAGGFVVNYDQQLQAAAGRVVEGGQILSCGSPWAPSGPAFERFSVGFARPTADRVIIKATGPQMNPSWWTPARCDALQRSNPTAYTTDVLAGFADPSSAFVQQSDIRAATRTDGPLILEPQKGRKYACAMDPGGRGNHWTLVVLASYIDSDGYVRYEVALAKSWAGTTERPLSPAAVLQQVSRLVGPYNVSRVASDQYAADAIRDLGARIGLSIFIRTTVPGNAREGAPPNPNILHRNDMYEALGGIFTTRTITIPNDPTFIRDMLSIRRVVTRTGVTYDLPETPDRRHCDYAPATALALSLFPQWPDAVRAAAQREHMRRFVETMDYLEGNRDTDDRERALVERARQNIQWASAQTTQNEGWQERAAKEWEELCKRGSPTRRIIWD